MTKSVWKKEHYALLLSHTNCDACCKEFQQKYPHITLQSIFTKWNHKKTTKYEYERILEQEQKPTEHIPEQTRGRVGEYIPLKQKIKILREAITSLNLRKGTPLPYGKLIASTNGAFTSENTIRAVISGYGTYHKKKTEKSFTDIVGKQGGALVYIGTHYPVVETVPEHTIMIPAKITHKYDKKPSAFIDEDAILVKDHNIRAEQVQLLKEIVSAIQHNTLVNKDMLAAIKQNIEVSTSTLNLFESVIGSNKKKSESATQQVTA